MEESVNLTELQRKVGDNRKRERSIRGTSSLRLRKNVQLGPDIETSLPSRTNLDDDDDCPESIVKRLRNDDTLKSDKDILTKIKNSTQTLSTKRSVKKEMLTENIKKRRNVSLHQRLGYSLNFASSQMRDSSKELLVHLEPWYQKLKTIEGHFGSGVATYFKFLRSLFFINFLVFIVSLLFVVVPQLLDAKNDLDLKVKNFRFGDLFTGEGYLSNSVLFYGHYTNQTIRLGTLEYKMPSAYFFSTLVSYVIVFILLSISMVRSLRKNLVDNVDAGSKKFTTKVICGWDFGIATENAADLKSKSIYTELKELLDEEEGKTLKRNWKDWCYILCTQISLNILLFSCLAIAVYFTWQYLSSDTRMVDTPTSMMISLTFTIVINIAPMFLIWLLTFEYYGSPRMETYVTIIRTFVLDAALIGVLIAYRLDSAEKGKICWETALGQEIYRLVLLDFLVSLVATPLAQFIRRRIYLTIWPKIGHPEMDIARNTIHLLYNEALFFVGLFFSPVLSLVILIKLLMTFYIRYWGAICDCKPSERMWRAAQTETVFLMTAFIAFILVLVLYGYILSSVPTSMCGPFRGRKIMYDHVIESLKAEDENSVVLAVILYVRKPGVVASILIILLLSVYYVWAAGRARKRIVQQLREAHHWLVEDKRYLLKLYADRSLRTGSTQEINSPREEPENLRRSQSLFDISVEKPTKRLQFNPIFTESNPEPDYDFHTPGPATPSFRGDFGNQSVKYTPQSHDDRIPSRIDFSGKRRN